MKLNEKKCSECNDIAFTKGLCIRHYHIKNYNERLSQGRLRNVRTQQRTWVRGRNDRADYSNPSNTSHNLSRLQLMWLYSRGGRTVDDIIEINGEYFTAMRSKRTYVPVFIPSDRVIRNDYKIIGNVLLKILKNKKAP